VSRAERPPTDGANGPKRCDLALSAVPTNRTVAREAIGRADETLAMAVAEAAVAGTAQASTDVDDASLRASHSTIVDGQEHETSRVAEIEFTNAHRSLLRHHPRLPARDTSGAARPHLGCQAD
jgi:hypothetical protein